MHPLTRPRKRGRTCVYAHEYTILWPLTACKIPCILVSLPHCINVHWRQSPCCGCVFRPRTQNTRPPVFRPLSRKACKQRTQSRGRAQSRSRYFASYLFKLSCERGPCANLLGRKGFHAGSSSSLGIARWDHLCLSTLVSRRDSRRNHPGSLESASPRELCFLTYPGQ